MIYKTLLLILLSNYCFASDLQVKQKFIPHLDNPNYKIEYYLIEPSEKEPKAVLIFLHGHQEEKVTPGGLKRVEDGTLTRYAKQGYKVIALSLPSYGNSDGKRDWCGPYSQRAVVSLIKYLNIPKNKIYLIGNSRGAVVAGMVATKEPNLAGLVLIANFYDLSKITHQTTLLRMKNEGVIDKTAIDQRTIMDKADKLYSPILILHGYFDERAPVSEAFNFYKKLMKIKKDVILMIFPSVHTIAIEQKYQAIDMFLKNTAK